MKTSVIIVNYNGKQDTLECLDSLQYALGSRDDVWIVDNASDDPITKEDVTRFKFINLVRSRENLGFSGGNNLGIKKALGNGADYILLLNNDTIVEKDFLSRLKEKATENDILAPLIYYYSQPELVWAAGGYIDFFKGEAGNILNKDRFEASRVGKIDFLSGCALFLSRKVFEKIGYFDERYFLYYEDTDFCLRARKAGFSLKLVEDSVIWHKESQSTGFGSPVSEYYLTRNALVFMWENAKRVEFLISLAFFAYRKAGLILSWFVNKSPKKKQLFRSLCLAIADALMGKLGCRTNIQN